MAIKLRECCQSKYPIDDPRWSLATLMGLKPAVCVVLQQVSSSRHGMRTSFRTSTIGTTNQRLLISPCHQLSYDILWSPVAMIHPFSKGLLSLGWRELSLPIHLHPFGCGRWWNPSCLAHACGLSPFGRGLRAAAGRIVEGAELHRDAAERLGGWWGCWGWKCWEMTNPRALHDVPTFSSRWAVEYKTN